MKVLIFEYITGGGFNREALPSGLVREGRLMLQALLNNFQDIGSVTLTLMLDSRLTDTLNIADVDIEVITPDDDATAVFQRLLAEHDAVWPIAPEFDGILQQLCETVAAHHKILLAPNAAAVALAGNKYLTYQRLIQHHIATVPTQLASQTDFSQTTGEWFIKPIDGAGCGDSFISQGLNPDMPEAGKAQFIVQPHLHGEKTSLSCLFNHGQCALLAVNQQRFEIYQQRYQLIEIVVNHQPISEKYQQLVQQVASAFPELWGYAGIDLIETPKQRLVLEINPRLTTSFAALQAALGLNIAQLTLDLLHGEPDIRPTNNQAMTLKL
jgi:predicted ATP-grasp superfamily ATP-dependent carboligase